MPDPDHAAELAPTGTLRVAVNSGNVVLVQPGEGGALHRIVPVLGRELARRLGVPVELIPYARPGEVSADAAAGAWDVCLGHATGRRDLQPRVLRCGSAFCGLHRTCIITCSIKKTAAIGAQTAA